MTNASKLRKIKRLLQLIFSEVSLFFILFKGNNNYLLKFIPVNNTPKELSRITPCARVIISIDLSQKTKIVCSCLSMCIRLSVLPASFKCHFRIQTKWGTTNLTEM